MVRDLARVMALLGLVLTAGWNPALAATRSVDDPGSYPGSLDEELAKMAEEIPGFGGIFYDALGYPNVVLLDPAGSDLVRRFGEDVRLVRGRYEFTLLRDWRIALRSVLAVPGVVMLDVDETRNRVVVGVEPGAGAGTLAEIRRQAASRSMPADALLIETVEPIHPAVTLRDKVRPVPGGMQINFSVYNCTLGFNAYRAGVFGFVTNSHCTNVQGGVESTRYYQPNTAGGAIGTETADPSYGSRPGCPPGKVCRYSDSAFARYDAASLGEFPKIARTTSRSTTSGSITISSTSPRFTVNGWTSAAAVGTQLNKMGRTTGWTYGTVTASCVDTNVSGTNITLLCQSWVNAGVGSGDSGSPVFYWPGTSSATLYGVLWGGSGSTFAFSEMGAIFYELGSMTVF